ncbi:MAG: hypothetical protein ACYDHH_14695 [Solirubrobacteraceae bacterium]
MAERVRATAGGGEAGRSIVLVIAVAAITLEVALFLPWQNTARPPRLTSVFGSVDRAQALLAQAEQSRNGWSALPLSSIMLTLLGMYALSLAAYVLTRMSVPARAAWALSIAATAGVVYCAVKLFGGGQLEADYVLRGYGATLYSGVFGTRVDHGVGVAIALAASAILILAAAALALLIHRGGTSLDAHGPASDLAS